MSSVPVKIQLSKRLNGSIPTLNVRISGRVRSSDAAHLVLSPRGLKMGRPGRLRELLGLSRLGCAVFCPPLGPGLLHTRPARLSTPEVQTRSSGFRVGFRQVSKRVKFTQAGACRINFR